jgi:aspartate/methionine/tyrosine aminotransferase
MSALYLTFSALLNPGDEVLMPTPGFPNLHENIRLLGAMPVFYDLRQEESYLPSLPRIANLINSRTRVLFLNSPSNPTGAVMPGDLIEQLVQLARQRDIWLLSDEVYDGLVLDEDCEHISPARFDRDGRVVSVYSFSKVYAMTGWRLGYVVANPHLADVLRDLQGAQLGCPNVIAQKAGEAALVGPREPIEHMRRQYVKRRDLAWDLVGELGLSAVRPRGAFYMMIDTKQSGQTSSEFAQTLLSSDRVAVAPGDVFGPGGEGSIRVSLAADEVAIEQGLSRIAARLSLGSMQGSAV